MSYYSLPDMAEAHKQSFFRFLNQGILEELEHIFPIYVQKGKIQLILNTKSLRFEAPKITLKEGLTKTYEWYKHNI